MWVPSTLPPFNTDKSGSATDVTYEVTISQAAIVWITVDDRHAQQQERVDTATAAIGGPGTFADTGIDLFVVGDNDRSMSVFAAELPAGTYVFGAMPLGNNFYSLGAIGL